MSNGNPPSAETTDLAEVLATQADELDDLLLYLDGHPAARRLARVSDRLRAIGHEADTVNTTPDFTNSAYHVRTEDGWSEPMTYDQVRALQPKLTEAQWQRYDALEATVGRAHEGDMP